MAVEVILPRVDMDMTTGRISRWYVAEGERVEKGQPLFEIETDKAAMEIEAPGSGILRGVVAADQAAIPVGGTVGWIYAADEPAPQPAIPASAAEIQPAPQGPNPSATNPSATNPPTTGAGVLTGRLAVPATPLARRLARQHDIALERILGSGPRRRVQARDVATLAAAAASVAVAVPAAAVVGLPALPSAPERAPAPALRSLQPAAAALHRAWLRQGEGRPLVLIHGFGAELGGWRPLVASLAPGRPILAVDLPGHGASPAAAAPSLEGFSTAVAATLDAEGIVAADLVGHSLGAAVAACLAETAAFDLRSLLLLSPAGLGPDINAAFLDGLLRARSEASLAPWLRLLVSDEAVLGQGFIRATARSRTGDAAVAALAAVARALFPDGTQAFSIRDILGRLDLPVRLVFGAEDRIIPAHHANKLPGAVALHLFPGIGHMPHLEIRPALARILADHARG